MSTDQYDVFGGDKSVEEMQIEKSKEILEIAGYQIVQTREDVKRIAIENGFKVSEPLLVNDRVVTLKDLRNYFYMKLWSKYPERQLYHVEGNWDKEMRAIRLFVESREQSGLNRFNAIQECVALIDIIFTCEEQFNFKNPIDIRVLGQGKAGWITQKASIILNEKLHEQRAEEVEKRIQEFEDNYTLDLNKKANLLDELIEKMEVDNGQK